MLQRNFVSLALPVAHALLPFSPTTYLVEAAKVSSFSVCTD